MYIYIYIYTNNTIYIIQKIYIIYIYVYNQSSLCRVALRFCTKHAVIEAQWPEAFSYSTAATGLGLALGYVLGGVHWSPRPEVGGFIGEKVEKTGGFGGNMGKIWGTYGFFFLSLSWKMDFQNFWKWSWGK